MGAVSFLLFAVDSFQTRWSEGKPVGGASPGSRAPVRLQHSCGSLRDIAPRGAGLALDAPLIQLMGLLRTPNLVNQPMMVRKKH